MSNASAELSTLSTTKLLTLYSRILTELIARRVVWSRNSPAGDYAELLVAEAYGGLVAKGSTKSWDVLVEPAGSDEQQAQRIQVKCRVIEQGGRRSHSFSPFRSFDFDVCVFVVFDSSDYQVVRALELDVQAVTSNAREVAWVAGKRLTVSQVMGFEASRDITESLRTAQRNVDSRGRNAGTVE